MSAITPRLFAAVAVGGAVGGVLRWACSELVADGAGFAATTFSINVVGSFLLALLPAAPAVRRSRTLAVGLGPGVLGGFTTLSAVSEQTRSLLDAGDTATAALCLLGTLAASLVAVAVASRLCAAAQQAQAGTGAGDR
ncbi:MAG: CrcB family protein [Nocardioides sp.]|nr:CrcB family protein [Nocardioides sp.]